MFIAKMMDAEKKQYVSNIVSRNKAAAMEEKEAEPQLSHDYLFLARGQGFVVVGSPPLAPPFPPGCLWAPRAPVPVGPWPPGPVGL